MNIYAYFRKILKFHENPSSLGVELFHSKRLMDGQTDRQTDRHDEANNYFSQFCERAENCTAELDEVRPPPPPKKKV